MITITMIITIIATSVGGAPSANSLSVCMVVVIIMNIVITVIVVVVVLLSCC